MKTINVSEASGQALNWLVAKAEGLNPNTDRNKPVEYGLFPGWRVGNGFGGDIHWYDRSDEHAGPIIDLEKISTFINVSGAWSARIRHTESHPLVSHPVLAGWTHASGPTRLVAAMRCYVKSKLGETAEVPEELL